MLLRFVAGFRCEQGGIRKLLPSLPQLVKVITCHDKMRSGIAPSPGVVAQVPLGAPFSTLASTSAPEGTISP